MALCQLFDHYSAVWMPMFEGTFFLNTSMDVNVHASKRRGAGGGSDVEEAHQQ